jgi:predicted outer membrane protein
LTFNHFDGGEFPKTGTLQVSTCFAQKEIPVKLSTIALVCSAASIFPLSIAHAADLDPAKFATAAASSDAFEIKAGQLAEQKGQQEKVKAFGKMMVEQHTQSTAALTKAAKEQGVTFSPALPKDLQEKLNNLQGVSGPTFDAAYLSTQISAHTKAVELFTAYSKNGAGGPIKAFAQNTLPVIRTHLVHAQAMTTPKQ